jgi:hypothetical protein
MHVRAAAAALVLIAAGSLVVAKSPRQSEAANAES